MNARMEPPIEASPGVGLRRRGQRKLVLWGGVILLGGFAAFLLWAVLAPLDAGVALEGTVTVDGYRKRIQHPAGGVVAEVPVTEGESVSQGQTLLKLDARVARAELDSARLHQAMAVAGIARLEAESQGLETLALDPALTQQVTSDPILASALEAQRQLFRSRRLALQTERAGLEQAMTGAEARWRGEQARQSSLRQRLALLDQRLAALRPLAEQDYVPRNRVLELEEERARLSGELAASDAAARAARAGLGEARARLDALRDNQNRDVEQALAEHRLRAASESERLANARFQLEHSEITAPVSGRVVNLQVLTRGSVIRPGDVVMELLPADEPLWVDARVPVDRIDSVHAGLPVELMFTAFNRASTPRIPATVARVSPDRLEDPHDGQPYYAARLRVDQEARAALGDLVVQPGMPVQAFVRTGERSLMSYLFKPLVDRIPLALEGQ